MVSELSQCVDAAIGKRISVISAMTASRLFGDSRADINDPGVGSNDSFGFSAKDPCDGLFCFSDRDNRNHTMPIFM